MNPFLKYILFFFSLFLLNSFTSFGQSLNVDSLRAAQKHSMDSLKAVQKTRMDSLKAIREYRSSQRFKDSLQSFRQHRADSMKLSRKQNSDSLIAQRKKTQDSLLQIRQAYNDSLRAQLDSVRAEQRKELEQKRAERQQLSDSLSQIRTYRSSQAYKDSLALVRKQFSDSLKMSRRAVSDSLRAIQVAKTDSMRQEIQLQNEKMRASLDSARAIRQAQSDSLAAVRKLRSDSLAQVKAEREATQALKAKEKEKKRALKLELEMSKKRDKYTNEDMRKKGWTLPRKVIQNTFTRYNYYFNANKKMEEAHVNMLRSNIDNYDSLIALFPFNPDKDSARFKSDMDTILKKAAVGIQIHDPRAKWQDNLYLLVGEAYYYKGDYQNAGSAFRQIIAEAEAEKKQKSKKDKTNKDAPISVSEQPKKGIAGIFEHVSSKNEAMLWLVRTLVKARKEGQAQTILDLLNNDPNFPDHLKGRLALEKANLELNREDFESAVQSLAIVSNDKNSPSWLRLRSSFLAAQIYQNQNQFEKSNQFFAQAVSLHPQLEMDFYARKNLVFNSLKLNSDFSETKEILKRMIAEDKYRPFYDQLYFSLAKTNILENNSQEAIQNLNKSIRLNQNNTNQKGISFATLGDEYYRIRKYTEAKNAYDSASMFLTNPQDPMKLFAQERAISLNEIAAPASIVQHQDSLLHLASLSEKEQRNVIRSYIKDYERQISDSAFLAANTNPVSAANPLNNRGQTWYFSNPSLVKNGQNAFRQKWGNRQLKDNWRRSTSFGSNDGFANDQEENPLNLPNEDSLYAAIPHSPVEIAAAKKELAIALFLLGKAYYSSLEDFDNALSTFDSLDARFPGHENEPEEIYIRYLIAMRKNQTELANSLNKKLQTNYSDSQWGKLLANAKENKEQQSDNRISTHYDETYSLLKQRKFDEVLDHIRQADSSFKNLGEFQKRYQLIRAIAIAGKGDFLQADTLLNQFITTNPGDSLKSWAEQVLNYIRNGGTELPGSGQTNEPIVQNPGLSTLPYQPAGTGQQYVLLLAPSDLRIFALRSGLMDYNLQKPGMEEVTLTMTTFTPETNLILIKSFKDAASSRSYINEVQKSKALFREYPQKDYELLWISEENYPLFLAKKNLKEYKEFINKKK